MIPNHSVLKKDPSVIGTDDEALYCVTDDVTCCGTPPCPPESGGSGNERGRWYIPDNRGGHKKLSGIKRVGVWYASWLTGAVLLNYRGDGTDTIAATTGFFRCDIRNRENALHLLYTCIYDDQPHTYTCKVHNSVFLLDNALLSHLSLNLILHMHDLDTD